MILPPRFRLMACLLVAASLIPSRPSLAAGGKDSGVVFAGVDANYSLGMERDGQQWMWSGTAGDLFQGMAERGVRGLRIRLWTSDEGVNGKTYATEVVKRGLAAGLEPYLVIFLSEDWADLMKQPAPAIWKDLEIPARAEAIATYSRDIVRHFRKEGLRSHLYEIGNEIDYGICGVYPGKNTRKTPESLSREHWPNAAELIKASQRGVREADPEAKFLLHIAHWWDAHFCVEFFRFMLGKGVQIDYAGLSYFPSSNIGGSLEMAQFGEVVTRLHAATGLPVIVPETAYPSTDAFTGQFSRWKKDVPGYPLTPEGQHRWLADFLAFAAHHPAIAAVYYWSPEWCGEGMWKAFALFDPKGLSQPAWQAFARPPDELPQPKTPVFFEIIGERLYPVPVPAAQSRAAPILAEQRMQAGGLTQDYIKAITEADLVVDGYRVNLRASLSGNLDLVREAGGQVPAAGWQALLKNVVPTRERAVVFVREPSPPLLKDFLGLAKEYGIETVVHEKKPDAPLKFGLAASAAENPVESD